LIEFLARIGSVEQLQSREFYQPESPNHYKPGQILVGFMLGVIAGARRFAHLNQLRADRALQALLGLQRFLSDDTILNYFRHKDGWSGSFQCSQSGSLPGGRCHRRHPRIRLQLHCGSSQL
jgi:hypothetical protein